LGLSLNLPRVPLPGFSRQSSGADSGAKSGAEKGSPLNVNLSGSLKGRSSIEESSSAEEAPLPIPVPQSPVAFDSAKAGCELSWSPGIFQFKTKTGYTASAKKEGQWDTAFSTSVSIGPGRFGVKVVSPDFPDKWNCTISWRMQLK
jgi:hypothetical protein